MKHVGTLVQNNHWVLRRHLLGQRAKMYQMTGVEAMAFIGWAPQDWSRSPVTMERTPYQSKAVDDALLNDCAGNAFSLFACTPLISACLAVMGLDM